jgi:hypothetical protein
MSHNDTLRVILTMPEDQLYALKLTPCLPSDNSAPPVPAHGRAVKIKPGEQRVANMPLTGYYHAHLVPMPGLEDTRPAPYKGRCSVMVEVERAGCLSVASFVTLHPPLERGGPWDPDPVALLVGPGERRLAHLFDGLALHLHEIVRFVL